MWRQAFVAELEKKKLIRIYDTKYINQNYSLECGGVEAAVNLMGFLYGEDIGDSVKSYLKELVEQGADSIPNDDILLLAVVEKANAKCLIP